MKRDAPSQGQILAGTLIASVGSAVAASFVFPVNIGMLLWLPLVGGAIGAVVPSRWTLLGGVAGVLVGLRQLLSSGFLEEGGFQVFIIFGAIGSGLFAVGWAVGRQIAPRS